ncbi:MAG TPA: hypothetical protein VFQ21_00400 [Gemmatimonadota bacterium]|nr:hypothetical protein [Gemmatimonadota bacterium]
MRWIPILALVLLASACGGDESTDDDVPPADTTALAPGGGTGGGTDAEPATTTGGAPTTAATVEATGAPSPPEGYAVESQPAGDGRLATIEYVSPRSVTDVSAFYDGQLASDHRVRLDVAGDDIVVYGLGSGSTIGPATRIQDVERLLDQRSEPMVVVAPHRLQASDPLIGDLREIGQQAQADALLGTQSKVTVVYAVQ